MPENSAISLFELNRMVRDLIYGGFPSSVWIIAEVSQITENRSGHCYLELIDKNPDNDSIRAISRATIWASRYSMIKPYFQATTGQTLSAGIKIMVSVKVDFHERYGLSLNIVDIEPSFTLGDLARKRLEIIDRLEKAGVLTMNQEIELNPVPQKIAIISSDTAAGYEDFIDQLNNNPDGYVFYTKLFPASMQGSETGPSIIEALDRIAEMVNFFDCVVIIRGGGGKIDLSSFDDFDLAYYITQFPLPVISGIGHERDESVVDLVSHTRCKTPTAVAEFIIQQANLFMAELEELKNNIVDISRDKLAYWKDNLVEQLQTMKLAGERLIRNENMMLRETALRGISASGRYIYTQQSSLNTVNQNFKSSSKRYLENQKLNLANLLNNNKRSVSELITREKDRLKLMSREADLQDPVRILKRGFSITFKDGKVLKSTENLKSGFNVKTRLSSGTFESKVILREKGENKIQEDKK